MFSYFNSWGFPGGPGGKEPTNAGDIRDAGSISASGRSPREGNGNPLHYSCLGNAIYRGAWWAIVQRFAESRSRQKQLSMNMHFISVYEASDYAWFCSPLQYGFSSNKLSFLHLVHICLIMYEYWLWYHLEPFFCLNQLPHPFKEH